MKTFIMLLFITALFGADQSFAQDIGSLKKGQIKFEKRINAHDLLDDFGSSNPVNLEKLSGLKKEFEQFYVQDFTLDFNQNKTQYRLSDGELKYPFNFLKSLNIFSDYDSQRYFTEEEIISDKFYISDSIMKINWRITDEKRTINGFECRRANAIVNDSIYIVAFYALNIPISGGPDIFNGLPGMILAVAVPHKHIAWVAKSILSEDVSSEMKSPSKPKKGTVFTRTQYIDKLNQMSGNWAELSKLALLILTL